jgi:hypothetical protein
MGEFGYELDDYYEECDDGWRTCEHCGEGFTIYYESFIDDLINGYRDDVGMILCDKCFKKDTKELINDN